MVEHVSAFISGPTGQTYDTTLNGDLAEYLVMTKGACPPGIDTYTASQPMRVYINSTNVPSPSVSVTNSAGGKFFSFVTISGYLVPLP